MSWSLSLSGEWTSWNWPGRVVSIKSNVFFSRVGKCTICSKPWSFIMSINICLLNFESKTSNFYGLPKIHKCKDVNDACSISDKNYVEFKAPESWSFRPTVAGPACETHRLRNLIDILLQPYTKHIKSYIKDTTDFLSKFPTSTNPDTLLVSFDVVNRYTNIAHDLGIEAIKYWLRKFPQELPARKSVEFLLEGIKFILENNYFCFNNTYFLQTKGTAMDTKFAPIYATLVLGYLEETPYI